MIQDGIYQYDQVQPFGPSTPVLVQAAAGRVIRYDWGTYTDVPMSESLEARVLSNLRERLADHDRFGAPIEFTPALVLHNPITGPAVIRFSTGGGAA